MFMLQVQKCHLQDAVLISVPLSAMFHMCHQVGGTKSPGWGHTHVTKSAGWVLSCTLSSISVAEAWSPAYSHKVQPGLSSTVYLLFWLIFLSTLPEA